MRLNCFKYHVQDRDYSRAEILTLINEKPYKHLALSGSEFSYSLGTVGETLEWVAKPITSVVKFVATKTWDLSIGYLSSKVFSYLTGGSDVIVVNNNYNNINSLYKITDIPNDAYTGREVAKFMNEFYDYNIHFNKELYYDNVISKFLNHSYLDSDVPTLGDNSIFDIAVLDSNN